MVNILETVEYLQNRKLPTKPVDWSKYKDYGPIGKKDNQLSPTQRRSTGKALRSPSRRCSDANKYL